MFSKNMLNRKALGEQLRAFISELP